jgi:hypothetical protein
MSRCPAITSKGEPCRGYVHPGKTYCPAHDPDRAEARRGAASKAGRSRAGSELHSIKRKLIQLGDDVLSGKANRGNAAVAATCYGTAIKAVEAELKVRELEESRIVETQLRVQEQNELIGRLEELEERLAMEKKTAQPMEGRRWGA